MNQQRWGLTVPFRDVALPDYERYIKRAEAAGYTDLWSGEVAGPDAFTPLILAAAWTSQMRLGTGIANVFVRGPALLAQQAASLSSASHGRFDLGLGVSSDRIVEEWNGIPFERPLTKMRETVEFLRLALAGERTDTSFKLDDPPGDPVPIVVAALRSKMLKLAVECADGVFTNFLPLDAMPDIAAQLKGAPEKFDLVHRFLCFPADRQEDRDEMEAVARSIFTAYVTVPVYEKHCRSLGYGDLIDPMVNAWRSGDRKAALQLAPWEAIEQLFLVGTPGQIKSKLEAYVDAGVTVPIVVAYVPPRRLDAAIDALAP